MGAPFLTPPFMVALAGLGADGFGFCPLVAAVFFLALALVVAVVAARFGAVLPARLAAAFAAPAAPAAAASISACQSSAAFIHSCVRSRMSGMLFHPAGTLSITRPREGGMGWGMGQRGGALARGEEAGWVHAG